MAIPGPGQSEATSLSALLDNALGRLESAQGDAAPSDGILYSGNRHESVPRALFLDKRLTPLERNAWQVFRLLLNDDGLTAFPTYDRLRPFLASTPCTAQASHETVARALTLLRLTRWLSLARRRRDPKTGRIKANLYVLHDEPLTPYEALQLDPDYIGLLGQAMNHASRAIQRVGNHVLREFIEDPMLSACILPTRLLVLAQRMAPETYPQNPQDHQSEDGFDNPLRNRESPSSESEAGLKASKTGSLRNPKRDRTKVLSNRINIKLSTVPMAHSLQNLRLPDRFLALTAEQQAGALVVMQQVDADLRQAVLDEWDARCCDSVVRNPAGYLFGIIHKAARGEFKAWAAGPVISTKPNSI